MMKKLVPVIVLLVVLGAGYKFVLAKPAASHAKPKPHVEGSVYMLSKEFLINLADGRFAKMQVGLVIPESGKAATEAAGGEGAPAPPEGYGTMAQEGVVRDAITDVLTDATDKDLIDPKLREALKEKVLKAIGKETDVKVDKVLFSDLTVQ
jgi:flagellar basal body-associated protein FliL